MLTGVIQKQSIHEIKECIKSLPDNTYDMLELRLDCCTHLDIDALEKLMPLPLPVIFTLRAADQGGHYQQDEDHRLHELMQLAALNPDYIDIEYTVSPEYIQKIKVKAPHTKLILSHHNFQETPADLDAILEMMRKNVEADCYKIATYAHSGLDALRMLVFCKESPVPIIGIAMGEDGEPTRILAPIVGSLCSYCGIDLPSAPGQLSADTLNTVYRYRALSSRTKIFGLLGNPVQQSIGHLFHNKKNAEYDCDAVYVKWRIETADLEQAVSLLKRLDVAGLSITMPLKEAILPLLDKVADEAQAMHAVNTIVTKGAHWTGYNTDGTGAVNSLPGDVNGTSVFVLGAGGAAKAIIYTLKQQGARVTLFNRTAHKKEIPSSFQLVPLTELGTLRPAQCDYMINTLPASVELEISPATFSPQTIVMDITYSAESVFLQHAKRAGCRTVDGTAMFTNQALAQRELWQLTS